MSVLWLSASASSAGSTARRTIPFAARLSLISSWIRPASDDVEIGYGSSESFPGTIRNGGVAVAAAAASSGTGGVIEGEEVGVRVGETVVTGITGVVAGRTGVAVAAMMPEDDPGVWVIATAPLFSPVWRHPPKRMKTTIRTKSTTSTRATLKYGCFQNGTRPGFLFLGAVAYPTVRCRPTRTVPDAYPGRRGLFP